MRVKSEIRRGRESRAGFQPALRKGSAVFGELIFCAKLWTASPCRGGDLGRQDACPTLIHASRAITRQYGFTLIELMVVVILIGIMSAMIIGEMKGTYEDALLRSTGRKLANVFNLAYSRAVTVNQLHRVRIDATTGRYFLERTGREGEGAGGFVPVPDVAGSEGELDTRISIEIRNAGEEAPEARDQESSLISRDDFQMRKSIEALAFYADGTADAKEVILRDREGFGFALRINPTTARVRIVELERK